MFRNIIALVLLVMLTACQLNPFKKDPVTNEYQEILDVTIDDDMRQIGATPLENGYLYTFTNNGLLPISPEIKKHIDIIELDGQHQSQRLAQLYPSDCQQLEFRQTVVDGYDTWLDMLTCGKYGDHGKGLLVVNQAIQAKNKHYSSVFYLYMPAFSEKVSHYRQLPISAAEISAIERFVEQMRIRQKPL